MTDLERCCVRRRCGGHDPAAHLVRYAELRVSDSGFSDWGELWRIGDSPAAPKILHRLEAQRLVACAKLVAAAM